MLNQNRMTTQTALAAKFRQLVVVDHSCRLRTAHLLVRSTSPENAEDAALQLPIQARNEILEDQTDLALQSLRTCLGKYLRETLSASNGSSGPGSPAELQPGGKPAMKLILNIHGYSTPLLNFWQNTFQRTEQKFERDNKGRTYEDFVVFIDYSWPSENLLSLSLVSLMRAMPSGLRLIGVLSLILLGAPWLFFASLPVQWMPALLLAGGVLAGFVMALMLLRAVTYFRDRERAASAGVYDAMELVRWMHEIFSQEWRRCEASADPEPVQLNILAHSMGCFVATQLVRTLSDVFDPDALKRWQEIGGNLQGPFALINPCDPAAEQSGNSISNRIGKIFELGQLVLVSPDIPVWALTNGRSNPLQACLRRFETVYLFTNHADIVLRLASTVANYFVFPSRSRESGYRLGNLTNLARTSSAPRWCCQDQPLETIGLYGVRRRGLLKAMQGFFNDAMPLTEHPFKATRVLGNNLVLVDCSDYIDHKLVLEHGKLICRGNENAPRLSLSYPAWRPLRYMLTILAHAAGKVDSHGGYFQGPFCLDLLYQVLVFGRVDQDFTSQLGKHRISWVNVRDPEFYRHA